MFLLDTDVASLLRRQDRHPQAAKWLSAQQRRLGGMMTESRRHRRESEGRRRDPGCDEIFSFICQIKITI